MCHQNNLMLFTVLQLVVLLAAAGWWLCPFAEVGAVVVASSSIEHCERRGGGDPLPCEKKMVVTLAVDGGQIADVEEAVVLRDAADKTRGSGAERVEFEPIRLLVSKSRVSYNYPLFYVRDFNAKPYEKNIATELVEGCKDSFVSTATCGLVKSSTGEPIPYSQGFCCACSVCQLAGICRIGGRGLATCDVFGKAAMASCLRFGELWYGGYNVGAGSVWYRVHVSLVADGANGTAGVNRSTFDLGPDVTMGFSSEFGAWARLVGDFVPPEMPLDLTGKMFFVPSYPKSHKRVVAGAKEWLLLDKHHVSVSGRECNKVGVSYEAFATQGSRCEVQRGSCLADQLDDYRARDLEAEVRGRRGAYMARFLGDFRLTMRSNGTEAASSSPYLSYSIRGSLTTMVTIAITADRLRYVQSVSPGEIVFVSVPKAFKSNSRDGVLTVGVRNTGTVSAQYTISVGNCTGNVFPIVAQPVSMKPQEELTRQFDLNVQGTEAQVGAIKCDVTLRNSLGRVTDTKPFVFQVMSVGKTNGTQGGEAPTGGGRNVMGAGDSACAQCKWYDAFCFLWKGCFLQLLVRAAVVVGGFWAVCLATRCLPSCAGVLNEERTEPNEPVHALPMPIAPAMSACGSVLYMPPRQYNVVNYETT